MLLPFPYGIKQCFHLNNTQVVAIQVHYFLHTGFMHIEFSDILVTLRTDFRILYILEVGGFGRRTSLCRVLEAHLLGFHLKSTSC